MQTYECLKEHMKEVINYVFCALCMFCSGSAVSWKPEIAKTTTDKACNECKTFAQLGLVCI